MMEFQPSSFQMSVNRARPQKYLPSWKNSMGLSTRPVHMRNSLTAPPSMDRKSIISRAQTVQEMKWGR